MQAALELKAAHSVEVAACRQVVADQAHQIRRLKWQHGNANVAASQLSQAYQQQHLLKMQASKDQQSISALKREVRRSKWWVYWHFMGILMVLQHGLSPVSHFSWSGNPQKTNAAWISGQPLSSPAGISVLYFVYSTQAL